MPLHWALPGNGNNCVKSSFFIRTFYDILWDEISQQGFLQCEKYEWYFLMIIETHKNQKKKTRMGLSLNECFKVILDELKIKECQG